MHLDESPISLSIFNDNGRKVGALNDIKSVELLYGFEDKIDVDGNVMRIANENSTLTIESAQPINTSDFYEVLGVDISKIPDNYSIKIPTCVQKRKHKKKRINKKWEKKYGYKEEYVLCNGWKLNNYADGTYEFVK